MKTKQIVNKDKVILELNQEELDDLIEEFITISSLLEKNEEVMRQKYEKEEDGDLFFRIFKSRINFANNLLEKLIPVSDYYSVAIEHM